MKNPVKRTMHHLIGVLALGCALAVPAVAQDSSLASVPPMGWNSRNHFGCKVSDSGVRAAADAISSNGMKAAGYVYINVDDCWQGKRDAAGVIRANANFPDMKALGDYLHSKGLKFGINSSPGPKTCAGYEGSYKHEEQDAKQYAAWGVDYLKYDWCSADKVYRPEEMPSAYKKMHEALVHAGRPIVFSMNQHGMRSVWEWGASVGGNLWRTTKDMADNYDHMYSIAHAEDGIEPFAGPGHWNDPDILVVGDGHMNHDEYLSHMSMWCMMAAPLLASNDFTRISKEALAILTNPEVIAVDQDPKGVQGRWVWQVGPYEIWAKPLADGSTAVLLINRGEDAARVTADFKDIGVSGAKHARDLWTGKDLGQFTGNFPAEVPRHGIVLVKMY
jgi:alpha-galactosidase